jgi:DNA helicase-4
MNAVKTTIEFNLIGRILGKDKIELFNNSLIVHAKDTTIKMYLLSECLEFAKCKSRFFGDVLEFNIGDQLFRQRFLSKKSGEKFLQYLNLLIADNLNRHLSKLFSEFDDNVVNHYPRDARLEDISLLCKYVHELFNKDIVLWEKYLPIDCIQKVTQIASFYPVNPEVLRDFHEKIQLENRADFFDRVESNPLTLEQRLGVIRSNDRNMVLAAAGTGKTSVIVAKILDLIDRGLASPSEILVLAYNRKAAEELTERLKDKAIRGNIKLESLPDIATFHALGRQMLRKSSISTYMTVFSEDEIRFKQWVSGWLKNYLASGSKRLLNFISLFPEPVNPFDFMSQAEYENYIRDNEFRTLNGEKVRGYQELLIANYLYINGVPYAYEAPYVSKRRIEIGFDYRPDFHLVNTNIYIEHFGIDRKGGTRCGIDAFKYNESMRKKQSLHAEFETTLIETFHYEWIEDTLLSGLEEKLIANGIVFNPLKPEEILQKLCDEERVLNWADLLKDALKAIRAERLTKALILERLVAAGISQSKIFAELLDELHIAYCQELQSQNAIDFDDMIIRAIKVIESGLVVPEWKFILVDEFQDISAARMDFIQAIYLKGPQPSLTVVGDDWQSIYRFSGGKLELTTRFREMVGAYSATKLQKTFRYNNSIADTAGQFIMENPEQYKKSIDTHDKVDHSQVILLDDKVGMTNGLNERVKEIILKIREHDRSSSIAIIARYNFLLNECELFLSQFNLHHYLHFWTFHRSKGLEADYCILIGFYQGLNGFPNENKDEAVIEALLPILDPFPHSEERRLFYVGLTRARKKSYIIADPTSPSQFVSELLAPKYDLTIGSKTFQEQYRKIFKCPHCVEGYLRLIKGEFGEFYRCSTGRGCQVGKTRVCPQCRAPSIDHRNDSICNNQACRNTIKICEKCGRPMKRREGKFGEFWGCSGYGIKDDQCKQTSRI